MSLPVSLKHTLGRWLAALLLAVMVWQLPYLYGSAQANIQYYVAYQALQEWEQGQQPTEPEYLRAKQAIMATTKTVPDAAHYLLTRVKVLEWGAHWQFEALDWPELEGLYKQAITLRPTWPVAYADYGFGQAFYGQDLSAALATLRTAEQYGPYLPEVLRQQLAVGLANWPLLSLSDKAWVLKISGRAAGSHWPAYGALRDLTRQYQRQSIVCPYLLNKTPAIEPGRLAHIKRNLCAEQAGS
ncbi:hypothetical protein [Lacimicrobium alkaliphilum]|uniref:Tetratricopeptide repeat protein n=1 Tax=Lacimicrobium alkaliphilum TaxID=1526571 RepID=A0ABQ1RSM4_9ALTE|nr:hypothetical protein [Lacimicrobium alkaliphilum]GGD76776.1 hypothetical protein GCM10011357_34780 [Lacimicrobium alkaliphilum]